MILPVFVHLLVHHLASRLAVYGSKFCYPVSQVSEFKPKNSTYDITHNWFSLRIVGQSIR